MTDETGAPRIRSRTPSSTVTEENTTDATSAGIRTRSSPATTTRSAPEEDDDWMKTGRAARRVQEKEQAKNEEKERRRAEGIWMPYRFWLQAGKQVELVILDDEPGPCFYEHQLQDPQTGRWDIHESCPKETEACPLCDGVANGKESYYVMMLTAMILDPYVNKNGVTVPHSRKLLAVKTHDQPFFFRTYEREGTLRGVHLLMARQSKQDSAIGRPEYIQRHSDADIMATFGHPEVKASDGRVLKQANADTQAFPYSRLFTRPSGDDLRRRYGGAAPMGSASDIGGGSRITAGRTTSDDLDDDEVPF